MHMEANKFLKAQLDDVGYQLNAVFAGLTDDQWNEKATPESMSPAETAEHLAECYTAMIASADGKAHSWGTYSIEDKSPVNLFKTMTGLREEAVARATAENDEKLVKAGSAYLSLHDAYHVGQMVTLRLKLGGFEPYSIYNH